MRLEVESSGRDRKKLALLVALLAVGGVIAVMAPSFGAQPLVLWQGLFVLLMMVALFLWVQYLLTSYICRLTEEDGHAYFYVIRCQGKRQQTLLRVSMRDIRAIRPYDKADKEARAGVKRDYMYTTAVFSPMEWVLLDTAIGVVAVRLEADPVFFPALRQAWQSFRSVYDPATGEESEIEP